MLNKIILLLMVIVVIIAITLYFNPSLLERIFKRKENLQDMNSKESAFTPHKKLSAATYKICNDAIDLLRNFSNPSQEEVEYVKNCIEKESAEIYKDAENYSDGDEKLKDEYIQNYAVNRLINLVNILLEDIIKYSEHSEKIKKIINDTTKEDAIKIISYEHEESEIITDKINDEKADVKKALMDFHFKRNEPGDWETREVNPMEKSFNKKLDVRDRTSSDDIIDILGSDNPNLMNNGNLLPKLAPTDADGVPINLEIANLVASNRRYYDKVSDSQFRSRGGDTRPMIPALIDQIVKRGNSRDPNSLQQSTNYSVLDILESGRGHSGNQKIDEYRNNIYDTMSNPFVRDVSKFSEDSVNKTKSGSLTEDKSSENRIISDILHGDNQEELWQ
jgi:hypothetical protein